MLFLERLFSIGPEALGSVMTGQAEEGIGDPTVVAALSLLSSGRPPGCGETPDQMRGRARGFLTRINSS
jgi:hypothetical protein